MVCMPCTSNVQSVHVAYLHNNTLAQGTVTNDDVGLHEYSC